MIKPLFLIGTFVLSAWWSCRPAGEARDVNGRVYRTVRIGGQVWMAENLAVTHYRNGDPIAYLPNDRDWIKAQQGAYALYDDDTLLARTYGLLYNWHAVQDVRGLAPEGWHIPTEAEVAALVAHIGGDTLAGSVLKAAGGWLAPHQDAGPASGFNALPGGYRHGENGRSYTLGSNGYWWNQAGSYELFAWSRRFYSVFAHIQRDTAFKRYGFAVRCVRDNE